MFLKHLELARGLNLPVILHCRKAHPDMLTILKSFSQCFDIQGQNIGGVVHCFTGKWQEAEQYLKMGFYLGLNGIIFKHNVDEVIKKAPLDKILIETDCPYLTPPEAGAGRNEPLNVSYVAKRIADLRQEPLRKIVQTTTENAKKLFNLA